MVSLWAGLDVVLYLNFYGDYQPSQATSQTFLSFNELKMNIGTSCSYIDGVRCGCGPN